MVIASSAFAIATIPTSENVIPPSRSIVAEGPWTPPLPTPDTIVGIRVAWGEAALARQVKAAGGKWNRQQQVWEVRYDQVVALGLIDRIALPTL
jgi:hypothetical protein